MLTLYDGRAGRGERPADLASASLPANVAWLDLLNPAPDETAFVARTTGLHVPTIAELSEIESSSRLRHQNGAIYLSAPLIYRADSDQPLTTPVGLLLTRERLITVRFEELTSFNTFINRDLADESDPLTSGAVFAGLIDAIADRLADILKGIASELDTLSHRLFRNPVTERRPPRRESADLRIILRRVGHNGDLASKIRDSLHGLARIVPYVSNLADWLPPEVKPRLDVTRQDVASLSDYDEHIANKIQLLLDATLGLINVEQSNIIKVLTIVSVVGIPPTLIATMYGMNFKGMPEYDWAWGYPYGLAMIALSAVLPLAERLMDLAEAHIRNGGYAGFSFRDLAAEIGNSASAHHYFPTKATMAAAVARLMRTDFSGPSRGGAMRLQTTAIAAALFASLACPSGRSPVLENLGSPSRRFLFDPLTRPRRRRAPTVRAAS